MYYIKNFIAFIILLTSPINAQWNYFSPSNSNSQPISGLYLKYIAFCDQSTGIFLANNYGIKTSDGGKSLILYNTNIMKPLNCLATTLSNDFILSCGGTDGFANETSFIYKSSDKGITWENKFGPIDKLVIYDFEVLPNGEIYALGNSGWGYSEIYKSTDNGETWIQNYQTDNSSSIRLYDIQFINNSIGYVYGDGVCYKTIDGGNNWNNSNSLPRETIKYFWSDINHGFIITIDNMLKRTIDSGNTWSEITLDNNNKIYDIYFVEPQTGWLCTSQNVYITTNYGTTWEKENIPIINSTQYPDFRKFYFYKNQGWLVGSWGYILIRDEYLTGIEEGILPKVYSLSQNYPNPFNPNTKISYSISKSGLVSLKVYDILGREIISLLNETMEAGSYEVTFDGSKCSSGIYFYKITFGDYIKIKKMVLLK